MQAEAIVGNNVNFTNLVSMTWTSSGGGGGGSCGCVVQGWIGSPTNGATIKGQVPVPVTVVSGISLLSGTLTYWPSSNPSAVTTLNSNTTGVGTIGTFDATTLADGAYTIQLNATSGNGTTQVSQVSVSVVGDYKPGRMTATITEFKVPLAGIPISITRTYDSLDKNKVEDFGFGWKLGTFVDLSVDAKGNVTFNFNGQKTTFFFTPQPVWLFGTWLTPAYTPNAADFSDEILVHVLAPSAFAAHNSVSFGFIDQKCLRFWPMASSCTRASEQDAGPGTSDVTASSPNSEPSMNSDMPATAFEQTRRN